MELNDYVNKIVDLVVDNDIIPTIATGKLSSHGENLYQVTGDHYVFRMHEVSGLHLEKSNSRLTIFIL